MTCLKCAGLMVEEPAYDYWEYCTLYRCLQCGLQIDWRTYLNRLASREQGADVPKFASEAHKEEWLREVSGHERGEQTEAGQRGDRARRGRRAVCRGGDRRRGSGDVTSDDECRSLHLGSYRSGAGDVGGGSGRAGTGAGDFVAVGQGEGWCNRVTSWVDPESAGSNPAPSPLQEHP